MWRVRTNGFISGLVSARYLGRSPVEERTYTPRPRNHCGKRGRHGRTLQRCGGEEAGDCHAFQEQGARWLESLQTRKRKPVAPGTSEDWERILGNWLNPHIGTLPISEVNNASLKRLVATMSGAGLSPKTIDNYAGLVKMVVASAVDAEGGEIFPASGTTSSSTCPS